MKIGHILLYGSSVLTAAVFFWAKRMYPALDGWQLGAQASGIAGLFLLSWSFILSVRHPFMERLFGGLDRMYKLHHIVGGIAFISVIYHPLFLVISELPGNTFARYFLPGTNVAYTIGMGAWYGLLLLIILTLFVDLPYKLWKKTHEWMGIVILLGAWHGLIVSSDLSTYAPLTLWMSMWAVLALVSYVYKRFLYYRFDTGEIYCLESIEQEKDIALITLKKYNDEPVRSYTPGQFAFLSFDNVSDARDEHPFSIVSQEGSLLRFGMKVVGPFTLSLLQAGSGARLRVRGPYGAFGFRKKNVAHMVWIAGGIGITPFLHFLTSVRPEQAVTFVVSSRGAVPEWAMRIIQRTLPLLPKFTFVPFDSRTQGRLTVEKIQRVTSMPLDAHVWLCGPAAFMSSLTEQFCDMGFRKQYIYYEDFSLR